MKISKNQSLINRINELNDINQLNMSMSELYVELINNPYYSSILKNHDKSYLIKEIKKDFEIEFENNESELLFNEQLNNSINQIDRSIYQNNPYTKNIHITKKYIKNLELKTDFYKPYELFALKDVCINKDYVEETSLAYFLDKFEFICIDKNNVTWMSIIPNEIETMKKPINNAKGNILILGLGLGYFAYMASQKEEVKQITIIENDADIIKLFNENLLPQFKNKHKIKIICDDAFSYLKKNNNYDYVFADLWHNAEDGISTYLTLKQMENKKCYYDYWLEDSFIALLRRAFISLLYEQSINFDESNYVNSKTILDKLINTYYKSTKNIELQNINQLEDLLQKENLLKLIIG